MRERCAIVVPAGSDDDIVGGIVDGHVSAPGRPDGCGDQAAAGPCRLRPITVSAVKFSQRRSAGELRAFVDACWPFPRSACAPARHSPAARRPGPRRRSSARRGLPAMGESLRWRRRSSRADWPPRLSVSLSLSSTAAPLVTGMTTVSSVFEGSAAPAFLDGALVDDRTQWGWGLVVDALDRFHEIPRAWL